MEDHIAFVGKRGHVIVTVAGHEMKCGATSWSRVLFANFGEIRAVLSWYELAIYFLIAVLIDATSLLVSRATWGRPVPYSSRCQKKC